MMSSNFRYNLIKTIKPYAQYFPQLTKPLLRALIQVSVDYLENTKCPTKILDTALNKLNNDGHTVPENVCELFAAILQIIQLFLQSPKGIIKSEDLAACLQEDLKWNVEFAQDLTKVLHNHRTTLTKNFIEAKMVRRSINRIQFRINVSSLLRMPQDAKSVIPTIVMHFQLPDGRYRSLELTVDMFYHLKRTIGIILNEMQSLSQRAVMKKF